MKDALILLVLRHRFGGRMSAALNKLTKSSLCKEFGHGPSVQDLEKATGVQREVEHQDERGCNAPAVAPKGRSVELVRCRH